MASLQIYSLASVYVDGKLLTEEGSVKVSRSTGSNVVTTVHKGYAGESPGAATLSIEVENAVPSADFELNPGPYMQNLAVAEITLFAAGKTLTAKGFIVEDSFSHSVGGAASLSFSFRGSFADWS
jgi:hypothetical protein